VIVFDAGVLIAHLTTSDPFHEAANGLLEEVEQMEWAVSALTLAECLVRPAAEGRMTSVLAALDRLSVLPLDLSATDAAGVAEIRASTRLRMPDAVVLYTAERHSAELATTDRALAKAAADRGIPASLL
jgi:predicted nucleic acid-binding protein